MIRNVAVFAGTTRGWGLFELYIIKLDFSDLQSPAMRTLQRLVQGVEVFGVARLLCQRLEALLLPPQATSYSPAENVPTIYPPLLVRP